MARLVFLVGLVLLAAPPASWLFRTWFSDAYASGGEWVFLLSLAIIVRSATSARVASHDPRRAFLLFSLTALVRFAGELAAVHVIGALALVIDVYALALALGLHLRARPASPIGVALLFAMSLPIERLVQRAIGYPLQLASTSLVCRVLTCDGVLVRAEGAMVSVDLPCSGARGLVLLLSLAFALIAMRRVRGRRIPIAIGVAIAGALLANTLRVFLLVEGVIANLDVLSEPWHSLIGLFVLSFAALAVLATAMPEERLEGAPSAAPKLSVSPLLAGATLIASIAVHLVPARPIDASGPVAPILLPRSIGGLTAVELPLSEQESFYFTQFGGRAVKLRYTDPFSGTGRTVIAVRTRAPLRHLHAEECLIGGGHTVERLGISDGTLPTATYRSTDPHGRVHRVEVSFYSERGERATSIAEVAWLWMRSPGTEWTMIERVTDWDLCGVDPRSCERFTDALARYLEIVGGN